MYLIRQRPTNEIKYVGLTRQTLHRRFLGHVQRRKLDPKEFFMELIQEDISLAEAVTLEEMLINQYETRKTGWNISPASINGYSNFHSPEQKQKWSQERKGKPFKGRQLRTSPNSAEHNDKISEANSQPIICLNDGKVYKSLREASKKLGLSESKISLVINGKRPHTKKYKFARL